MTFCRSPVFPGVSPKRKSGTLETVSRRFVCAQWRLWRTEYCQSNMSPSHWQKNYTARSVRPTSIVKGYRWNAIYTYTDSFQYVAVYFPDVPRISAPFPYNTVLWIFLTDVPFCYLLRCELRVNRFKPVHQPGACIFSAVRDLGFKHTPAGLLRFNTVRNTFKYQYTFRDKLINLDRRRIIFHDPTCKFIFFPIPLRRRSALFISLFVLALAVLFYYRYVYYRYVYSVCTAAEFNKNKINK